MTLAEFKAWLDGMIDATGDERLKAVRAKLNEVVEAAPAEWPMPYRPDMAPPPYVPPLRTGEPHMIYPVVTCGTAIGRDDPNIRCWN